MMNKLIGTISAAVLVLALQTPAQGFELRVGASANFGTTNEFGVGPRVEFGLGDYVPGLRLAADYHKFFDSTAYSDIDGLAVESNSWDLGFHALYDFAEIGIGEGATLYAGAGMLYAKRHYDHWQPPPEEGLTAADLLGRSGRLEKLRDRYNSDSGVSFALSVGSTFNTGWTVIPFVEARYTIGVVDELMVTAGLFFSTDLGAE